MIVEQFTYGPKLGFLNEPLFRIAVTPVRSTLDTCSVSVTFSWLHLSTFENANWFYSIDKKKTIDLVFETTRKGNFEVFSLRSPRSPVFLHISPYSMQRYVMLEDADHVDSVQSCEDPAVTKSEKTKKKL